MLREAAGFPNAKAQGADYRDDGEEGLYPVTRPPLCRDSRVPRHLRPFRRSAGPADGLLGRGCGSRRCAAGGPIRRDLGSATPGLRPRGGAATASTPVSLPERTNLRSRREDGDEQSFRSATIAAAEPSGRLPPTASQLTLAMSQRSSAVLAHRSMSATCERSAGWRCAPCPGEHQPRRRRRSLVLRTTSTRLVVGRGAPSPGAARVVQLEVVEVQQRCFRGEASPRPTIQCLPTFRG